VKRTEAWSRDHALSHTTFNRRRLAGWLLLPYALVIATAAGSLEWPLEDPTIVAGFGHSADGRVLRGVRLIGASREVRAIGSGELIFSRGPGRFATVPPALGSYAVLEHAGGLRSVYAHLDQLPADRRTGDSHARAAVAAGETIGRIGLVDFAGVDGLLLSIHDPRAGRAVNPLSVLPALVDQAAPAIAIVELMVTIGDAARSPTAVELAPGSTDQLAAVASGRYDVAIAVTDSLGSARSSTEPAHRVVLYLDGREHGVVTLDALVTTATGEVALADGITLLARVRPASDLVLFRDLDLAAGERHLAVVVSDFAGNSAEADYFVLVTTD